MAVICLYAATPLTIADELLGVGAWLLHTPPDRSPYAPLGSNQGLAIADRPNTTCYSP
jgi:hypothetical protein